MRRTATFTVAAQCRPAAFSKSKPKPIGLVRSQALAAVGPEVQVGSGAGGQHSIEASLERFDHFADWFELGELGLTELRVKDQPVQGERLEALKPIEREMRGQGAL